MTLEPMQLTALGAAHRIYYFLCDMRQLHSADSDKRWLHVTSFVQDVLRRDNLEGSKIWRRNSKYESRILASADKAAVGVPFLTGCVQYPLPKCNLGFSGGSELLQNFVARSRQANVIDCGSTAYSIFLPEERPNTYRY
jgi:hypothetical protein